MSSLKNNPVLKKFADSSADALLRAAASFLSRLGLSSVSRLKFAGDLFYRLLPLRKATLADNIRKAGLCADDDAALESLIHKIYVAQALNFFEFLWMRNLADSGTLRAHFRFHGLERLRRAILGREGGVIVSSHFGNWEMLAVILGKLGVPLSVLTVERDLAVHRTVNRMRAVTGNELIDRNHAALKCMRLIKANKFAGIMADQHTDNSGVETKFFGRPCMSTSLPAALSLKTGAPIYGIFMVRSGEMTTHDIYVEPPIYARDYGANTANGRDAAIAACTQAVNDVIEKYVRMAPEQWFWFHKRWRGGENE